MPADLRMVRMRFDVPRLFELGKRRRLPAGDADLGYLLHCELKELFGDEAPGPFFVLPGEARHVTVVAYTTRSKVELAQHARAFADPGVFAACDFSDDHFAEKEMPREWRAGERLGFEARVCPIVRMSSAGRNWAKGAEVDAFLARCWKQEGQSVSREEVYRDWLAREVGRGGAAQLLKFDMHGFQRDRLLRRDHGPERRSHLAERPDVRVSGELQVEDGAAFSAVLARGLGRHRAFGFGMLILRPARPC